MQRRLTTTAEHRQELSYRFGQFAPLSGRNAARFPLSRIFALSPCFSRFVESYRGSLLFQALDLGLLLLALGLRENARSPSFADLRLSRGKSGAALHLRWVRVAGCAVGGIGSFDSRAVSSRNGLAR
jgi:hypothetical protein